jgi:SAM-dependent methyltransferase
MTIPTYAQTKQAWRDIWAGTDFDRELRTLSYPRSRELIQHYQPYLEKNVPLLEAGCGPAHVVYYFRQQGYNMIGVDYAPEGLLPTHRDHPQLPLHLGDVHHLPYKDNAFGAYLSFGVVEHFEHGPLPALREAYRVLRPQGKLILTVPHPNFVEDLRTLVNRIFPQRLEKLGRRAAYFETYYTHQQMADFVRQVGFRVLKVIPYSHSFTFWGLHPIFRRNASYYESSWLGEVAGRIGKSSLPWRSAFECLVIAEKT